MRMNRDHDRTSGHISTRHPTSSTTTTGFEETAHRLQAKRASLQPLTTTAMTGTQAEAQSADTATGVNRATPTTASEIMAADPISCPD
jgi:hypothetical protein